MDFIFSLSKNPAVACSKTLSSDVKSQNIRAFHLHHVGGMGGIVVPIVRMVVSFYDDEPVVQYLLVATQNICHFEVRKQSHSEMLQRALFRQILQPENVKVP